MKNFFFSVTVAMITVKKFSTHFHSTSCQGNIFLHQAHAIVQTIIEKMESNRKFEENLLKKICHKVVSCVNC